MPFEYVRSILMKELYKIGGELFADAAINVVLSDRADNGDEQARKDLGTIEFAKKLIHGMSPQNDKEKQFNEILKAWNVLNAVETE